MLLQLIYLFDWTPYFGGWDMPGLLAAASAGAAGLGALVVARIGAFYGFALVRWLVTFFKSMGGG